MQNKVDQTLDDDDNNNNKNNLTTLAKSKLSEEKVISHRNFLPRLNFILTKDNLTGQFEPQNKAHANKPKLKRS